MSYFYNDKAKEWVNNKNSYNLPGIKNTIYLVKNS
jgi:hypothetical protein